MVRLGYDLVLQALDDGVDGTAGARQWLVEARGKRLGRLARRDAHIATACVGEIGRNHLGESTSDAEIRVGLDGVENRRPLEGRNARQRFGHAPTALPNSGRSTTRTDRVRSSARYAWILSIVMGSVTRKRVSSRSA